MVSFSPLLHVFGTNMELFYGLLAIPRSSFAVLVHSFFTVCSLTVNL